MQVLAHSKEKERHSPWQEMGARLFRAWLDRGSFADELPSAAAPQPYYFSETQGESEDDIIENLALAMFPTA